MLVCIKNPELGGAFAPMFPRSLELKGGVSLHISFWESECLGSNFTTYQLCDLGQGV